ncbi:FAD:protein FMN transferase [Arthrobacter sp. NPDC055138]
MPHQPKSLEPAACRSDWSVWGLEASVVVCDPGVLGAAEEIVRAVTASVDEACSRFRPDSELARLQARLAAGATVSPLLGSLVESALAAARWTDGDVDPTLGKDLEALGYDRDIGEIQVWPPETISQQAGLGLVRPRQKRYVSGWSRVSLRNGILTVPDDVRLDLGATAKAVAADMAASRIWAELGTGALVSLGGDLSAAGPAPEGGWQILVQDVPADPAQQVSLSTGCGMATSSTQKRRWRQAGTSVHHILDPRFGLPAAPVWRSVTVAAPSCLEANALSTAAVVRGLGAVGWFLRHEISGRLVDGHGRTTTTGRWPSDQDAAKERLS